MTLLPVVSNSSPIIALDRIGQLELLSGLFAQLTVPPAVVREVAPIRLPEWVLAQSLSLSVIGTLGLLLASKRRGLLSLID